MSAITLSDRDGVLGCCPGVATGGAEELTDRLLTANAARLPQFTATLGRGWPAEAEVARDRRQ